MNFVCNEEEGGNITNPIDLKSLQGNSASKTNPESKKLFDCARDDSICCNKPEEEIYHRHELAIFDRIDEIAIEAYDATHSHRDDQFDPKTGSKIAGAYDKEKLEQWQAVLQRTI